MQQYEVIVIGAGIAGLVAALQAAELGVTTLLAEKSQAVPSWSNSRISGGALHVAHMGPRYPPQQIRDALKKETGDNARPDLVDALVQDAPHGIDWLRDRGIRFVRASASPHHQYVMAPPPQNRAGLHWEGRGGDVALRTLLQRFRAAKGTYRNATRATRIVTSEGEVRGVEVSVNGGSAVIGARAVVLCDGGFQANPTLVNRYIGDGIAEKILLRAADTATGDGLVMAKEVGAAVTNLDSFYGHVLSRDSITNASLWPYPMLDQLVGRSMVLDETTGRRFVDEGIGGVRLANAIAKHARPASAVAVFDASIWNAPSDLVVPANPNLQLNGGTVHSAPDLDRLAELMGTPRERLRESVASYNAGATNPGRVPPWTPIVTPPYYAVPLIPAITYTLGGILTDSDARVVSDAGGTIPGLYAAGTTAGGLDGGPRAAASGGLMQAVVFGIRAAKAAADYTRQRQR